MYIDAGIKAPAAYLGAYARVILQPDPICANFPSHCAMLRLSVLMAFVSDCTNLLCLALLRAST